MNTTKWLRGKEAVEAATRFGAQLYKLDRAGMWIAVDAVDTNVAAHGVRKAEVLAKLLVEVAAGPLPPLARIA